ncbi:MAG: ASCH domain-containing protein [Candidatus Nealsonbacteria bacterium]
MEHLAIMRKSWGLTDKILNGEKKIESRWYSVRYKPWDSIREGEIVYFKDSGGPVRAKAQVSKVMQFAGLTPAKVKEILNKYGEDDGLAGKIPEFFERFKDKKYCILIFLKNPQKVKPFKIDKTGFGTMSAWITVDSIVKITYVGFRKSNNSAFDKI